MATMAEYVDAFLEHGVVRLPAVMGTAELTALRQATDRVLSPEGQARHAHDIKRCAVVDDEYVDGDTLCRLEYCLDKDPAFIRLLGHPLMLSFAATALRCPFLLTWEDMLIKMPLTGIPVPPHQDLKYQSTQGLVFSMGIYLDDSSTSPLEVIPGTHRLGPLTPAEWQRISRQREAEYVPICAQAGDVIVHNVLALHRSLANHAPSYRRTLYFEFRALASVLRDSPWSISWASRRADYISAAVEARAACPALTGDDLRHADLTVNQGQPFWQWRSVRQSAPDIDWRVSHDDISYQRPQDELFL